MSVTRSISDPRALRSGDAGLGRVIALALPLERRLELGQMPITFDPVQARFDREHRADHPAVFLIRRASVVDPVGQLPELGIE